MSWYETASFEEKTVTSGIERRRITETSIAEAVKILNPHIERLQLTEDDVFALGNMTLMGWPVPESRRHDQGTHVLGEIVRDDLNGRSGMRKVVFLAKEHPSSPKSAAVDISDQEKPIWSLDRFLHPSPYERIQEKAFQIWFFEVKKHGDWFKSYPPAYSISFTFTGMPDDFAPHPAYFDRRIKEEWYLARKEHES